MSNINRLEIAILTRLKWQNLTVGINSWKKRKEKKFSKLLHIPNKKELKDYQSSPTQIETIREKMQSHLTKNAMHF